MSVTLPERLLEQNDWSPGGKKLRVSICFCDHDPAPTPEGSLQLSQAYPCGSAMPELLAQRNC